MKDQRGFTLLEVIIAVAILSFISIYTAQSIQSGIRSKVKISNTIEKDSLVRDALKVIADDISKAFNYRDINIELYNRAQDERKARATKKNNKKNNSKKGDADKEGSSTDEGEIQGATATATGDSKKQKEYKKKEEVILTHFIGRGHGARSGAWPASAAR